VFRKERSKEDIDDEKTFWDNVRNVRRGVQNQKSGAIEAAKSGFRKFSQRYPDTKQ
jgi:hypothetical protein